MSELEVRFVGTPDGPTIFVDELGCEVGTFTVPPGGKHAALNYHVPPNMRGEYRPEECANYDRKKKYRVNYGGKAMCLVNKASGDPCRKLATNRSYKCMLHGGRLHPLDKVMESNREYGGVNGFDSIDGKSKETEQFTRYQQFKAGQITIDDLDDEEIAACGFRAKDGRIYKPRNVPRELASAFQKAMFDRAHQELRSHTVTAAQTVAEIMKNKTVEPDIRLKAASILLDRNLGKAAQVVSVTTDAPWEEVFNGIATVSREESRKLRGIGSSNGELRSGTTGYESNTIDAEVISDERFDSPATDSQRDSGNIDGVENSAYEQGTRNRSSSNESQQENQMGTGRDSRLYERNEAILAPYIEVKPYEFDLSDKSAEIKKATKKRYASRALGVDLTGKDVGYIRIESINPENGNVFVRHLHPDEVASKVKGENASAAAMRRSYTLGDFG